MAYAMLARNASRQMDLARPVGVLAHDEDARTFLMVVVVEFIPAWLQWLQANYGFAIAADDLFRMQAVALKFHCRRIKIFDTEIDRHLRRRLDLCGLEAVILHTDGYTRWLLCDRLHDGDGCEEGKSKTKFCNIPVHRSCSGRNATANS